MKILRFFPAILLFFLPFQVHAQNIEPTSAWRVNFNIWEPGVSVRRMFYKDYLNGDTIINGRTYWKVFQSGYGYFEPNPFQYYFYFNTLHGFLRSENHKWYTFYNNYDTLLYDFTMQPGDTVYSAYTFSMEGPVTVESVDSIMIGNAWKKRFNLNNEYGATWIIEDVGASSGLLENLTFFEWDSKLLCYAQGGVPLWSDTTEECNLNVAVPESNPLSASFAVSPNPARNYTRITLPVTFRHATVKIYDMMGRVVFQLAGVVSNSVTIPLTAVSPGLYLVTATSGDSRSSVRLVIK